MNAFSTTRPHSGPKPLVIIESDEPEAPPGPFVVGQRIAGAYDIVGVLGSGGMGVVYDAIDVGLRRRVAIKTARSSLHAAALRSEGLALAALTSPFFVTVHALGTHDGVDFLVLERLSGEPLDARIAELRCETGRVSIADGLDLLVPIAEALAVAHAAGLSQRDLKPANVFWSGERVVLFDMGIAVPEALVVKGAIPAGSLHYIAPEVVLQDVERGAGPLVDLYSLGILAYELFAGRPPFDADSIAALVSSHVNTPPPDLRAVRPDVPDDLAALVKEMMSKQPSARPPSAEAVLWQLEDVRARTVQRATRALEILVIDDDPAVGVALRRSLEVAFPRLEVQTTTRPAIALQQSSGARKPDIVLVDLNMPEHNGIEVCMHFVSLPAAQRPIVVAMSAEAGESDVAVLRSLGVRDFVPKDERFVTSMSEVVGRLRRATLPPSVPAPRSQRPASNRS